MPQSELTSNFSWQIGELPFYWGPLDTPQNGFGLPDNLSFNLSMLKNSGCMVQVFDPKVDEALTAAYKLGSQISGMMEDEGIGKQYAEDFLLYINKVTGPDNLKGKRVLEIGCGSGYLLSRLKEAGADVLGVEPGDHCLAGAAKYNVPIIHDFFPSTELKGTYDIILIYNVLEHIIEPDVFIKQIRNTLTPGGQLIVGVPDCEPFLKAGDISIFIHEHWSYFTKQTLINTLILSGAGNIHTQLAGFGSDVYAACTFEREKGIVPPENMESSMQIALEFKQKAVRGINNLNDLISRHIASNRSLGVFVASRLMNMLPEIRKSLNIKDLRFFDDNPKYEHKYFPGISIPLESRQKLVEKPVDTVLIMSRTFGDALKVQLSSLLDKNTTITTWNDIFTAHS